MSNFKILVVLILLFSSCETTTNPTTTETFDSLITAQKKSDSDVGSALIEADKTNMNIPIQSTEFIPCANNGMGELVDFSGTLHLMIRTSYDANGGLHFKETANPQLLKGIGRTTGIKYQGAGVTNEQVNINVGNPPYKGQIINSFNLIGQGPGNNLRFHSIQDITIFEGGSFTIEIKEIHFACVPNDFPGLP